MPRITKREDYNGFSAKVVRLGLGDLVVEVESAITTFKLLVEETKHANGTRGIRKAIDDEFDRIGGWTKVTVGGTDWSKANDKGGRIGVEVQVSGRSDMLAVDIIHLREGLVAGELDVGVIIVPDDTLSRYLTDRTPNFRTAVRHVESRARDMPVRIIAFNHDGVGPALPKIRTNLGRLD